MLALGLAALLAIPAVAEGHPVKRFWEFDRDVRKQEDWFQHKTLKRRHNRWHKQHPTYRAKDHREFHHSALIHRDRIRHKYRTTAMQQGEASYYGGARGACGVPLKGLYAAHRTWPCGTKVSVRRGNRYVVVKVLDRGPFISGRVIDLSSSAFDRLGDLSSGVMGVKIYRLKKR